MRRHLLGIIAIVLLVAGPLWLWREPNSFLAASCLRIGAVLAALWLAMPQLTQLSQWLYRAIIVIAIVAAAFSRYAVVLIPLLAVLYIFRPTKARGEAKMDKPAPNSQE